MEAAMLRDRTVVICTLGTRGDIAPFLPLASALKDRARDVVVLANNGWRSLVEAYGCRFSAIAPDDPPQDGRDDMSFYRRQVAPSFGATFDQIAAIAAIGPTMLVYRTSMTGAECAAEVLGLPSLTVALQPSALPSRQTLAWPLSLWSEGQRGPLVRTVAPPLTQGLSWLNGYSRLADRFRRTVGASTGDKLLARRRAQRTAVLCPEWFAQPRTDWPSRTSCVGFPDHGPSQRPDRKDDTANMIVFTPGTGVSDPALFGRLAQALCATPDMRGLMLSRNGEDRRWGPNVSWRAFAPLAEVLADARLIVHHGGIGTTAEALRAGIPQLILPDRFDQPDNALRIGRLGLGAAAFDAGRNLPRVVEAARSLIGDKRLKVRLRDTAERIAADDSTRAMISLLDLIAYEASTTAAT